MISVIMSVYNEPEKWLRESIDSILNQTYNDFEFIIINDNPKSTEIKQLLSEYKHKDERIIICNNKINIGLTKSLNIGLEMASHKYIARMDADDICESNRLASQLEFLEANSDYVACGSNVYVFSDDKNVKVLKKPETNDKINSFLFYESPIVHPTLFFIRSSLRYSERFIYSQDFDFISQLSSTGKLYNIQDNLLYYRTSQSQITSTKLGEQNKYADSIRGKNILVYLKTIYKLSLSSTNDIYKKETIYQLLDIAKRHKSDRQNISAILYTSIFYSKRMSFNERVFVTAIAQPYLTLTFKYRVRLLLANFIKFKDQNF